MPSSKRYYLLTYGSISYLRVIRLRQHTGGTYTVKLNADIVSDNLSQAFTIEFLGKKKAELTLKRPEFYGGTTRDFKANVLYVAFADQLPLDPNFDDYVVIICLGKSPPAAYNSNNCACLVISDTVDLFAVFNNLQQLFNTYDEWDGELHRILHTTASIEEMVKTSYPIFENPIIVIGPDYHYLAYSSVIDSKEELEIYRPDEHNSFSMKRLSDSIDEIETTMDMVKPFIIKTADALHYCTNLFVKKEYVGNFLIPFVLREYREGDIVLAQYLSRMIEKAINKHSKLLNTSTSTLKEYFYAQLKGLPTDSTRHQVLGTGAFNGQYTCLKIILNARVNQKVPIDYICNQIENAFIGSVSFEHESAVVAFFDAAKLPYGEQVMAEEINNLLVELNLKAGASDHFSNLSNARLYYRQASVAFELGALFHPELSYHPFQSYSLQYMLFHCTGEFPVEFLFTEGVRRLINHDINSPANYVETLRIYLTNNMNVAQTAKDLHIHRSTFWERIKRIESILHMDLKNSDHQLYLLMVLKLFETKSKTEKQVEPSYNGAFTFGEMTTEPTIEYRELEPLEPPDE